MRAAGSIGTITTTLTYRLASAVPASVASSLLLHVLVVLAVINASPIVSCSAFVIRSDYTSVSSTTSPPIARNTTPSRRPTSSAAALAMSFGAQELANNALRQSPSTTQFYTHKMCPYAQKVWIALEAGSCPYEMQQIDLYGSGGKPDWFLELNPAGQVPVVTCFGGAKILIDSEYILTRIADGVVEGGDTLRGGSDDVEDRVDAWRKDINNKVKVVGKEAVLRGGKNVDELMELLKSIDGNIVGPYLTGESVTVADCSAFPMLWRLDQEFGPLTDEDHGCGNIRKWLDKCSETDAFKNTIQSAWWWWW